MSSRPIQPAGPAIAMVGAPTDRGPRLLPGAGDAFATLPAAPDPGAANAFRVIHRLLRGRYGLTVALAGAGALAGALAGYLATGPKFETRGVVSIQPVMPKVIYETEVSAPMQYFTSFVNKQAMLMRSARVLALAVQSEPWRASGRGAGPDAAELLRRRVRVDTPRESPELIFVSCTDEDPRFTSAAVDAVLRAYEALHGSEGSIDAETIKKVEDQRDTLQREIDNLQSLVRAKASEAGFGTEDLTALHGARLQRVMELEAKVDDLGLRLREAGALGGAPEGPGPPPDLTGEDRPLTPMVIAAMDPDMRRLRTLEFDLETRIGRLEAEGYGTNHASVRSARAELAGVRKAIQRLTEDWEGARRSGMAAPTGASVVESLDDLRARYEALKTELDLKRAELKRIDDARSLLSGLNRDLEYRRDALKTIFERHRRLTVEASGPEKTRGRINVMSYGDTDAFPSVDKRKQLAALGFVAGGGLPVGVMLLVGFVNRRFRYSDEAGELAAAPTLLGILPVLPQDLDDPEQRAVAAHCVHQVRLLLQISAAATGRKVYAITSPTAGDGKTSLALSLGLSFSAAGSRTLLIDFDMIGTGLSSNLKVNNGHGLAEALRTGVVNGDQLAVASERLWVIPSRHEDEHWVSRLSAASVQRLIGQVREAYDVVLIDTGPVLGSLEASLVCAEADGVVMVVGRGQRHDHVEQAFARVAGVGGRLAGMVFNRATPGDFRRSVSSTSMRSVPRALPAPDSGHRSGSDRLGGAGPVVRTMALDLDAEAGAIGDAGGDPVDDPA